jgi:alanine dehydrogenase
LSNDTLTYAIKLADQGLVDAVKQDPALARGVNTYKGHITYAAVAEALGAGYKPLDELL